MKLKIWITGLAMLCAFQISAQLRKAYENNESYTYEDAITAFQTLADNSSFIQMKEMGLTDVGRPLHAVVFNSSGKFDPTDLNARNKTVILINNAIHPGESCGVDASILLMEHLSKNAKSYQHVLVIVIPVYNIGGMLNRSPFNRSGQPGPVECGFRGNYQNLDLNRDFIKCDSKNAFSFIQLFQLYDPDIFIDTHTTNGTDHQYTLTLITSQISKMNPVLRDFVTTEVEPTLYDNMKKNGMEIIPYVHTKGGPPETGIVDFMETPRFSSGYANLFDCMAFITEAHKYKSFKDRVLHTHAFLQEIVSFSNEHSSKILQIRKKARVFSADQQEYYAGWKLDTTKNVKLNFKGYEAMKKVSPLTTCEYLSYDRDQPRDFTIDYYRTYTSTVSVKAPKFYVIPQCYEDVIERLQSSGVELNVIEQDSVLEGEYYYIEDYISVNTPYENHFVHSNVRVRQEKGEIQFYKGDYMISTHQRNRRFILETLEPQFEDSYFNWNFFDNVLQQKEWFSGFAFDPIAQEWLENNNELKNEFLKKQAEDSTFVKNHNAQLYWVFQRTPYYEKTHNRYPVLRIFEK